MNQAGVYIEFERRERFKKNKRWTINYLLNKNGGYCTKKSNIISTKTYRLFSSGANIKKQYTTQKFCDKLNMIYCEEVKIEYLTVLDQLYDTYLNQTSNEFIIQLREAITLFTLYKDYFYYKQLLSILLILQKHENHELFTSFEDSQLVFLLDVVPTKFKTLLLYFKYMNRYYRNTPLLSKNENTLFKEPMLQSSILYHYLLFLVPFIDEIQKLNDTKNQILQCIINKSTQTDLNYIELNILSLAAQQNIIEFDIYLSLYTKNTHLYNHCLLLDHYRTMGIHHVLLHQLHRSYDYFSYLYQNCASIESIIYCNLLASILHKEMITVSINSLQNDEINQSTKVLLNYFFYKQQTKPNHYLRYFLELKIIPLLPEEDVCLRILFTYELQQISTHHHARKQEYKILRLLKVKKD